MAAHIHTAQPHTARPHHPYLGDAPPRCVVLLDLHVNKNAGTTMRELYWENERRDDWLFWGYTLDAMRPVAAALLRSWEERSARAGANNSRAPLLKLVAELHTSCAPCARPLDPAPPRRWTLDAGPHATASRR